MADAPKRYTTVTAPGGATFTGGAVTSAITLPDGTAAAPALAWTTEPDVGFYRVGSNDIGVVVGDSVHAARFINSTGVGMFLANGILAVGNSTPDTYFVRSAAGVLRLSGTSDSPGQLSFNNSGQRIASAQVTLTEAGGAETVVTITTTSGQMTGGRITYTVRATDATDLVARSGAFSFVCVNAATVVTASLGATAQTDDGSVVIATGGATLTYAIAADVATANALKITFNIDSSLVVSAASITYTVVLNGPGTVA